MLIDFVFFIIIFTLIVLGYKKGFSGMFISLIGLCISIILALTLFNWFGTLFVNSSTGQEIQSGLSKDINKSFGKENKSIENVPYLSSITGVVTDDEGVLDFSILSDSIATQATKSIIIIPLIILTVLLLHLSTFVFRRFFKMLTDLPLVHNVDCGLGSFCGLLSGILVVSILFVFTVFLQFVPALSFLQEQFNNSNIVLLINDFIL